MTRLYIYVPQSVEGKRTRISLKDALDAWDGKVGFTAALVYTPSSFRFAKIVDSKLCDQSGDVPLNTVFEARLFGETAELRWLHRSNGKGDAVLLTDSAIAGTNWLPQERDILETPATQYVLWGTGGAAADNGWTTLKNARIGELLVPYAHGGGSHGRVVLKAQEYLEAREYGNVVVVEERLTGFASL